MMPEAIYTDSYFFEANGLRHHYWRWGKPGSTVIIMLHGIRSYGKTWVNTANALKNDFEIISLDMRGRGQSDWSEDEAYFIDDYIADMEALVDHLGIDRFIVLGHSLGGQNAYVYAAKHPQQVQALLVEDIGPGSSASGEGAQRIVREFNNTPARFANWQQATEFWRSIRPNISEKSLQQRVLETLCEDDSGDIVWAYDFEGIKAARLTAAANSSRLPDLWPCVDSLRCPTLVIRGALSDFFPRQTMTEMVRRNATIETNEVSNATHYVHDDNFEEFIAYVKDFLSRHGF